MVLKRLVFEAGQIVSIPLRGRPVARVLESATGHVRVVYDGDRLWFPSKKCILVNPQLDLPGLEAKK